jgi:hypothetical protein
MDSLSGKSALSRFEICSELHAVTHSRSPRCDSYLPFHSGAPGPATIRPSGARTTLQACPARTDAAAHSLQVWRSSAVGRTVLPSIARPTRGSQASPRESRKYTATCACTTASDLIGGYRKPLRRRSPAVLVHTAPPGARRSLAGAPGFFS